MITQIDEQQVPVVALAVDPSRNADSLADVRCAELPAIVGAIGVHDQIGSQAENCGGKPAPRFNAANIFVKPRGPR
jgi:hypothetical protein